MVFHGRGLSYGECNELRHGHSQRKVVWGVAVPHTAALWLSQQAEWQICPEVLYRVTLQWSCALGACRQRVLQHAQKTPTLTAPLLLLVVVPLLSLQDALQALGCCEVQTTPLGSNQHSQEWWWW
jgi:hypothetical protein